MNLTAGTALQHGKYLLGNVLGQGELCTTLQATQAYLNQTVVLKTIGPNQQAQTDIASLKQRFIEEARRFAQCQHPGLVRVVDLFIESGLPFAAMDYVAGQSLANLVQSHGALSEAQALQYIQQAGSALSVIHRNGIVHQDINPQNLIRPEGADFVVLVDFGIIHQPKVRDTEIEATEDCYAAIEQFQPQAKPSVATDIYALAGTLYFLLTGQKPIVATLREKTPLPSPRKLQPQLSSAIESAILSGLEMNSQSRPQTIAAWFALLPGSEALPPVHEFSSQQKHSVSVRVPQTTTSSNGSKLVPSVAHPSPTQTTRAIAPPLSTISSAQVLPGKSRFPKAFVATALISAALGLGAGLLLRFSAASGIGPKIFHTQQSFPPLNNWPGSAEPTAAPLTPLPPPPTVRRNLEPLVPLRSKPAPVIPSLSPTPQPPPEPTIEAFPSPNPGISSTPSPVSSPPPLEPTSPQPSPSLPSASTSPEASPTAKPEE